MATKTIVTEQVVDAKELAEMMQAYWENQSGGLQIRSGSDCLFEFAPIKEWLRTIQGTMATDEEILEAHRLLLNNWVKTNPLATMTSIEHGGIDFPRQFRITVQITLVSPIRRHCVPVIPVIDDAGIVNTKALGSRHGN